MRILPVVDLLASRVVRAIRGERSRYQPLSAATIAEPTPSCVGRFLAEKCSFREAYVADLDAIQGRSANESAWRDLTSAGLSLWLDAGIATALQGIVLFTCLQPIAPASRIIAGLETIHGPDDLASLVDQFGPDRVVFSLDLRDGKPLTSRTEWSSHSAINIARKAIQAGCTSIILLDLASVGTGAGLTTLRLLESLRREHAGVEFWVGGGVAGPQDITAASAAGATGCLVGSAIYDGAIASNRP